MSSKENKRKSTDRASVGSPPPRKPEDGKESPMMRSPSATPSVASTETLTVVCRFRAPKATANKSLASPYVFPDEKLVKVNMDAHESKLYQFDTVFPPETQQYQLFGAVEGTIDAVMSGFNATILAYGQTSAGKTHTMEGPNIRANLSILNSADGSAELSPDDPESPNAQLGIIPRTIEKLFKTIRDPKYSHIEFTIRASYFEIYCEKLRDLLHPASDNMKLREYSIPGAKASSAGFVVQDLTEMLCAEANDIYNVIDIGKAHRATAPTLMNAESSRSHSILLIKCNQKPTGAALDGMDSTSGGISTPSPPSSSKKASRLYLVDLAGSEKVGKTGATGERLKEAQNINRSLTTFGMVINALSEGLGHVPYRDSKLTMILQDSIGGNSKTTLIICCSPESPQLSETLSTLRFGERAKRITNVVKVNEELGINEYKQLCNNLKAEVVLLKRQLAAGHSGVAVEEETDGVDSDGVTALENQRGLLEASVNATETLKEQVENLQYRCLELQESWESEKNDGIALKVECNSMKGEIHLLKCLSTELQGKLFLATTSLTAPTVTTDETTVAEASETTPVSNSELAAMTAAHGELGQQILQETQSMQDNAHNAELLDEYIKKYDTLYKDSNTQIDRIMAKLTSEQSIRVIAEDRFNDLHDKCIMLEDQLHQAQAQLQTQKSENSTPFWKSSSSNHSTPAAAAPTAAPTVSVSSSSGGSSLMRRSSLSNMFSGAVNKMFSDGPSSPGSPLGSSASSQALQAMIQTQSKQLIELTAENKRLHTVESQLHYELDCTKEQYDTLLLMKDNILKSILAENKELEEEQEASAALAQENITTIEHLTNLLRNSLQRNTPMKAPEPAADQYDDEYGDEGEYDEDGNPIYYEGEGSEGGYIDGEEGEYTEEHEPVEGHSHGLTEEAHEYDDEDREHDDPEDASEETTDV